MQKYREYRILVGAMLSEPLSEEISNGFYDSQEKRGPAKLTLPPKYTLEEIWFAEKKQRIFALIETEYYKSSFNMSIEKYCFQYPDGYDAVGGLVRENQVIMGIAYDWSSSSDVPTVYRVPFACELEPTGDEDDKDA